jgi:hypothetical protein
MIITIIGIRTFKVLYRQLNRNKGNFDQPSSIPIIIVVSINEAPTLYP